MPELPEVEVTRRRLEREIAGKEFARVIIRAPKLRLPVPLELVTLLPGRHVRSVARRGKYLMLDCECGWLIIHLGMTGFLRILAGMTDPGKHDHLDFVFVGGALLRFHDPRKFGTIAWTTGNPLEHPLLAGIGPEPLTTAFDGEYLFTASRNRRVPVKQLIMNAAVVAGVGNIYANEALFRSGIRPDRPAGSLDSRGLRTSCGNDPDRAGGVDRGREYLQGGGGIGRLPPAGVQRLRTRRKSLPPLPGGADGSPSWETGARYSVPSVRNSADALLCRRQHQRGMIFCLYGRGTIISGRRVPACFAGGEKKNASA